MVYVPDEEWVLTMNGKAYTKGWHEIEAQKHQFIALVKKGADVLNAF